MNVSLSHVQNIWQPKLERSLNLSPFDFWWIFSFGLLPVGKLVMILIIVIKSEYVHLWPFDEYAEPYTESPYSSGAQISYFGRTSAVLRSVSGHVRFVNSRTDNGKTWHWKGSLGTLYTWAFYFLTLYDLFISACQANAFVKPLRFKNENQIKSDKVHQFPGSLKQDVIFSIKGFIGSFWGHGNILKYWLQKIKQYQSKIYFIKCYEAAQTKSCYNVSTLHTVWISTFYIGTNRQHLWSLKFSTPTVSSLAQN